MCEVGMQLHMFLIQINVLVLNWEVWHSYLLLKVKVNNIH